MKKVLITGGTGTIGSAFIKHYQNEFEFHSIGHSEKRLREFVTDTSMSGYLCSVENREQVFALYNKINPDIVIHAAAVKHVDFADKQPITATKVNVLGSLNIIAASQHFEVPVTIAISTDKASGPRSVYGYTKLLMEKCILEADQTTARFAVCRFGNVVGSAGSVIPIWREQASKNLPINITDERMMRFMFSVKESVGVIRKAIEMCESGDGSFVLAKLMKVVSVIELAKCISPNIKIIGIRPGEQLDEYLFNKEEAQRAESIDGFVRIGNVPKTEFSEAYSTETAPKMSLEEIRNLVESA